MHFSQDGPTQVKMLEAANRKTHLKYKQISMFGCVYPFTVTFLTSYSVTLFLDVFEKGSSLTIIVFKDTEDQIDVICLPYLISEGL